MLPFGNVLPKKILTPNIIGKKFYDFLISRSINIQIINKRKISKNINIQVRLKMWKSNIQLKYLNLKK